jgi:hypothetical protein
MTNATERMFRSLEKIRKLKLSLAANLAIAEMLGLRGTSKLTGVVRHLAELDSQLDAVEAEIEAWGGAPAEEWRGIVNKCREGVAMIIGAPGVPLSNTNAHWSADVLSHLKLYGRTIEKSEVVIPENDLDRLHKSLDALISASRDQSIPAALRATIEDLIQQFKAALRSFAARGGRALSDVILTAAAEMHANQEILKKNGESDVVKRLGVFWKDIVEVSRPVRETMGVMGIFGAAYDSAKKLVELVPVDVLLIEHIK